MLRVGLQGELAGAVRLHQYEVCQGSQHFIGNSAINQLSGGGAPGSADDTVSPQGILQCWLCGIQHRGQVPIAQKVGAGAQQHPARQFISQSAQQGGFSATADDGRYAALNTQQGSKLHLRHLLFTTV